MKNDLKTAEAVLKNLTESRERMLAVDDDFTRQNRKEITRIFDSQIESVRVWVRELTAKTYE